jgi:hypothetical protein
MVAGHLEQALFCQIDDGDPPQRDRGGPVRNALVIARANRIQPGETTCPTT